MSETLSVVIPCYTQTKDLIKLTRNAVMEYSNKCDELIIVEDGGIYGSQILPYIADHLSKFVYHQKNVGFTKAVNSGWKLASGDFTAIVNSDTFIEEGNIRDLCVRDAITHPIIVGSTSDRTQFGAFFVVPKNMAIMYGDLDESYHMYYSDDDYIKRVEKYIQQVDTVKIRHAYGFTTNIDPQYYRAISKCDKIIFEGRHV